MSDRGTYHGIAVSRAGAVGIITLDRPGRYNALDRTSLHELLEASITLRNDASVRAVLVTGTGDVFCPGADVAWMVTAGDDVSGPLEVGIAYFHGALSRLVRMDKPVITAVNGVAAGGGFSLALCGDLVLARADARFVSAYSRIAVSPDGGLTYFLTRTLGVRRSLELVFTNRELSAQDALDWGLVTRVLPVQDFREAALAVAQELAAGPTQAFARSRDLLYHGLDHDLEAQLERETQHIVASARTQDMRRAVKAFVDKAPQSYEGR
ncbi:MAG TPA: enoyl-CoA hydratase-related protein [bacterium]